MAKEDKEYPSTDPGAEEIEELNLLAERSIPNRLELVNIYNPLNKLTVTVSRDQVYRYASVMSSNNIISELIGIDTGSLVKHFSRELKLGRAFGRQKLITRAYHLALYGNNPADRIFALKNWTNMSDAGLKEELEDAEVGVDFKVRRPVKPVESLKRQEHRSDAHDVAILNRDLEEQSRLIEENETD